MTADIITFDQSPEARLRLALRRLDEAMESQRRSIASWQDSLGELKETTGRIADGLNAFHRRMDEVKRDLESVGEISAHTEAVCNEFIVQQQAGQQAGSHETAG